MIALHNEPSDRLVFAHSLSEREEAELAFVLGLVDAGCDAPVMERLLEGLAPPYAFHSGSTFYNFAARAWYSAAPGDAEQLAEAAVAELLEDGDRQALARVAADSVRALRTLLDSDDAEG